MPVRVRDLVERRVPHVLAIYLGAGWGLIEFISFLEERFAISPVWTNLWLFAWILLIPSVLLYTWNHGRPGRDEWVRSEKIGIPLNIVLTLAILTTAFAGDDLGATMRTVTVTDESGAQIERTVPKSTFRKRVALFWFDAPQDTALAWAREGAAVALSMDLLQDLFLDVRTPQYFKEQLREAGLADGYDVPISLKQQIAQELHLPYFVGGHVAKSGADFTVTTRLYETATSKLVKERSVTNADMMAAIDELSVLLRQDLSLPTLHGADMKDLPVAELVTNDAGAARAMAEGYAALMRDDWAAADRAMARATTLDPTFGVAHYVLYQARSMRGDAQSALTHLARAMQLSYRMPERMHMIVKIENFFMQQQSDQALAVATMMVELYPDDVIGHQVSAQLYSYRREFEKAVLSLRRVMALDPQQQEVALQIGALQEALGQFEDALKTYTDYAAANPTDAGTQVKAGQVQVVLGRLADAKATFERARLIDPASVTPRVQLAMIERNNGDTEAALRMLEQALAAATTPNDSLRALGALQSIYDGSGRVREAVAVFARQLPVAARAMAPMQVLSLQLGSLDLFVRAGQRAEAEAMLARIRAQMTPPLDEMWQQGALIIAMEMRDTARIHGARPAVQRIMDGFALRTLEPLLVKADAALYEARGDWNGMLQAYQKLTQLEPGALNVQRDIARAQRHLGRLGDALLSIEKHLRSAPYSAASNLEAARIRLAQNDAAVARTHLDRAARVLAQADAGYADAEELKSLMAQVAAR